MESNSVNVPSTKGLTGVGAAGKTGERETNAPSLFKAPQAAKERETNAPCPRETAENTGTRETNVPEERSAALRRDGEPLTSAAKRRRQTEADAEERQAAAGERPSSPVREDEEELPPLVDDPAGQQVAAAAITGREGAAHENSESIKRFEEILREEAREMLTGYLRDGTEYLSASMVRRVVQVASMSVVGSAIAVSRLDKEVRRVTTTYPEEDPVTLADHMVRMCEEEVLDWMRTRTVHPGPDADPDQAGSPTGQELVKDLEKILAKEEADRYPPPGSKEDAWMMKVLEQATKVLCLAEEAGDGTTKGDWQPCTYRRYWWRTDQETGHLCALFGGPEEDEVRVKGQRLAKAWLARAQGSVTEARTHMGLQIHKASELNVAQKCQHDGPPTESRPCEEQARAAIQRADRAWRRAPRRMRELCGDYPDRAGWPTGSSVAVEAPDGGSEFSPGFTDSESDTGCSESCDSGSSDPEMGDSEPQEAESEGFGPPEAEPGESESSGTGSEDSDSSEAESEDSNPFDMEARRRGRSRLTQAARIPPPPPTQKSRTRAAPTRALQSRPHQTLREISPLLHRPWKRLKSSAGRWSG